MKGTKNETKRREDLALHNSQLLPREDFSTNLPYATCACVLPGNGSFDRKKELDIEEGFLKMVKENVTKK